MKLTTETDLQYYINYYTTTHGDCEACGCDTVCRCLVIESFNFNEPFTWYNAEDFISSFSSSTSIEEKYLEVWWLKKLVINPDWFIGTACGGYYGEETESIKVTKEFVNLFNNFISLNPQEKFKKALETEYDYVLLELEDLNKFSFKLLPLSEVHADAAGQQQTKHNIVNGIKTGLNRLYKNTIPVKENQFRYIPLCIKRNNKWVVIDGHHRYKALKSNFTNKKNVLIFAAE